MEGLIIKEGVIITTSIEPEGGGIQGGSETGLLGGWDST